MGCTQKGDLGYHDNYTRKFGRENYLWASAVLRRDACFTNYSMVNCSPFQLVLQDSMKGAT